MAAGTFEVTVVGMSEKAADRQRSRRRSPWSAVSLGAFVLSLLAFAGGGFLSLGAAVGIVATSRATAYMTVGTLLLGFASAIFAAHALDKTERKFDTK